MSMDRLFFLRFCYVFSQSFHLYIKRSFNYTLFYYSTGKRKKKHKNHIKVESRYYNEYLYLRITTWISILDSNKMLDLFTKNYEIFYIFNGKNSICIARCFSWFILRDCMNNVNELLIIKYTYSCMLANIS